MKFTQNCLMILVFSWLISGCAILDDSAPRKPDAKGLITTPPSYYSTTKAKYLGTKYRENLDRLVERIVRNPKTATLRFANNISSVGGIGFFTHSATKTPDERYLEVVLATPETFETKGEYSEKVHQLFSRYGRDLLNIVNGDSEVYQDRELSGYGLNLAWRNVIAEPAGNRVAMARAIIYFPKERVRSYLRDEINQNDLLGDAVIFGEEENGPLALVSYQAQNPRPDFRPAIREDNLASAPAQSQAVPAAVPPAQIKDTAGDIVQKAETAKKDSPPAEETAPRMVTKPTPPQTKAEAKTAPMAQQNPVATAQGSDLSQNSIEKSAAGRSDADTKKVALQPRAETPRADVPVVETKSEAVVATPQPPPTPVATAQIPMVEAKPAETQPATVEIKAAAVAPASKATVDLPSVRAQEMRLEEVNRTALNPPVETKKTEPEIKASEESRQPAKSAIPPKPADDRERAKPLQEVQPQKPAVPPAPIAKAQDKSSGVEGKVQAPVSTVSKAESRPAAIEPPQAAATSTPRQSESPAKRSAPAALPPVELKAQPLAPAREERIAEPVAVKPAAAPDEKRVVTATKDPHEEIKSEPKAQQPIPTVIASAAKSETAPQKSLVPAMAPIENLEEKASRTKTRSTVLPPTPVAKATEPAPTVEPLKPAPVLSGAKTESPVVAPKAAAPIAGAANQEKLSEKPAGEQFASLKNKPLEVVPEKKILTRPLPKALEGFIIQLAFNDKEKAQHWAEAMERRGFAVSITEAGADGALRVRLGNFALRDEAERQLRTFKQDGVNGIIINLPQAFRPEARSSVP